MHPTNPAPFRDALPDGMVVMQLDSYKVIFVAIALFAIMASLSLLSYLNSLQRAFTFDTLLSHASPIGVLAIFGILLFGGIYLFNASAKIIKQAVK